MGKCAWKFRPEMKFKTHRAPRRETFTNCGKNKIKQRVSHLEGSGYKSRL